jgi:hypothetical protein
VNPIFVGCFQLSGPRINPYSEGYAGAFVWIAAQAEDEAKLRLKVESAARRLGLIVAEGDDLEEVIDEARFSEAVAELLPEARRNVESVVFGTWHMFQNQDA